MTHLLERHSHDGRRQNRHLKLAQILALALFCAWAAGCASAPVSPPPATAARPAIVRPYPLPPPLASPEYGAQAFLWWTISGKTADNDARLVRDLGFGWLKQIFGWRDIELERGHFDWSTSDAIVQLAEKLQLKLLIRLDSPPHWSEVTSQAPVNIPDFTAYCAAVAARYAGRIAAYEVWNEPNLAREWGGQPPDPAGYVALLKACYSAIKQADPSARVVSAGLAPTECDEACGAMPDIAFFQAMYDAGAAPYFDALGAHAPGYASPPERSPQETEQDPAWQGRVWTFRHVEDVWELMVKNGDVNKQIAITEMGWTTDAINPNYSWYAVTEQQQADYLVRAYQFARNNWAPWISIMITIYIANPAWTSADEQFWWSITRPVKAGDPPLLLPAYNRLKMMEKLVPANDH